MIFDILLKILQVYTLIAFINCIVSFSSLAQNRWTVLLSRICEPACATGRSIAAKVLKNKQFSFDIGPLAGLLLLLLTLFVIQIIF